MVAERRITACLREWPALAIVCAGLLYFCIAVATIATTSNGRDHASIWPADAVILALLLSIDRKHWLLALGVGVLSNHLANDVARGFHFGHLLYGLINMAQVALVATAMRRQASVNSLLADVSILGRFVLWGGIVGPVAGAVLGSLVSMLIYEQPFAMSFLRWFMSNALGFLVATPLLKAIFDGSFRDGWRSITYNDRLIMAATLTGYGALVAVVFFQTAAPLLFLPLAALILLAFKLGRHGIEVAVMILAIIGTLFTVHQRGPIALMPASDFVRSIFFQFYLAISLCTALIVVAIVASRTEMMQRVADRESLLNGIFRSSPDAILGLDEQGICTFCAGPTDRFLGINAKELVGMSLASLAGSVSASIASLDTVRNSDQRSLTVDFNPFFNPEKTIESTIAPLERNGKCNGWVVVFRDVTVRKRYCDELKRRALVDDLTQIWNRAGFYELMDRASHLEGDLSLALIDVDDFKSINDTFGHASGDVALAIVAKIIGANICNDDIVGRLGGDEFAILFNAPVLAAQAVCERISAEIRKTQIDSLDRRPMPLSISCGVAGANGRRGRQALFEAADAALYEVKAGGRDGVKIAA